MSLEHFIRHSNNVSPQVAGAKMYRSDSNATRLFAVLNFLTRLITFPHKSNHHSKVGCKKTALMCTYCILISFQLYPGFDNIRLHCYYLESHDKI